MGRPAEEIILGAEGKHPGPAAVSHVHYNQRPHLHPHTAQCGERRHDRRQRGKKRGQSNEVGEIVPPGRIGLSLTPSGGSHS